MFSFFKRFVSAISSVALLGAVCAAAQTYTISTVAGGGSDTPGNGPATNAQLYEPYGVVQDAHGNIYFTEVGRNVVRKVTPDGTLSIIAGKYFNGGFSGDGGLAVNAQLSGPYGLALDSAGNLYVADSANRRVRKISADGIITTVAGGGNPPCCNFGDGGAATSAIVYPQNVAFDSDGNMYIAEPGFGRVRKVDTSGIITTILNTRQIETPVSVAPDSSGNLYVVSSSQSQVFKVGPDGTISLLAGTGTDGYSGDGGPAISAQLFAPMDVALDSFGNAYITDYGNGRIRIVNSSGVISTIAGSGSCCGVYDGEPATSASIPDPENITVGAEGKLYFTSGGRVYRLTPGPLIPTETSLRVNTNPQTAGSGVTFTATVGPLSGGGVPTGHVTFTVDGTAEATVPLDNSETATYSTAFNAAGTHTVTATYSGDAAYSSSTATLTETITITVLVTFSTAPSGLSYTVDGTSYAATTTLALQSASEHTVSVISPQTSGGIQHTFSSWSDGGAQTHVITIPGTYARESYTANFNTAYLLTTIARPADGGSVSPASGNYYPAGAAVLVTATPNNGYSFINWSGPVARRTSVTSTVTMRSPETITASFGPSGATSLSGNIVAKAGSSNARIWSVQISNSGPSAAVGAEVAGVSLTQSGGAACTPLVQSLPVLAGDLAPGGSTTVPVSIDFSACAANARFTARISLWANGGSAAGSFVRFNQFQ